MIVRTRQGSQGAPIGPVMSRGLILVFVIEGFVDGLIEFLVIEEFFGVISILIEVIIILATGCTACNYDKSHNSQECCHEWHWLGLEVIHEG